MKEIFDENAELEKQTNNLELLQQRYERLIKNINIMQNQLKDTEGALIATRAKIEILQKVIEKQKAIEKSAKKESKKKEN